MNRPARKLKNLEEKLTAKSARSNGKTGAKQKRWKKSLAAYKPLVEAAG